jgi:O-antigen/teichoic acid export membrane protein
MEPPRIGWSRIIARMTDEPTFAATAEAAKNADRESGTAGFARLSRDSFVYVLGSILGKGIGLVMLPILTRLLSPAEYGRVDVLSTLGSAAISGLLLGMDVAAMRLFFDAAGPRERQRLLVTWCALAGAIVVPVGLGLMVFSGPLSDMLFATEVYGPAVASVGLVTVFGTYHHIALTTLRAAGRPGLYAVISAGTLLLNAALAVWLLLSWDEGVTAVIASLAVSLFAAGAVGLFLVRDQIRGGPGQPELRSLLLLGLPLAPAVVAGWAAEFANRAILLTTSGAQQVAFLAVALRIASIAGLAVVGFQLAWQPYAFGGGSSPAALARLALDAHRFLVGVAAAVAFLALVAPEVLATAGGSAYGDALAAVGVSLIGALAGALYLVTSMPSALARRMSDLGIASIIGVTLSVIANVALAIRWGASGTAVALMLSPLVAAVIAHGLGSRRLVMPIRWGRIVAMLGLAVAVALVATVPPGGAPLGIRLALAAVVVLALRAEGTLGQALRYAWHRSRRFDA